MSTEHTPWHAVLSDKNFESQVNDSDGEPIAIELSRAQATLIAAAPEMIEALRDVESKIVAFEAKKINWRPDDFLFRVRKVIANAEGRQ